ncbi:unnamed protein product, partial [marine sediment metagenome]
TLSGIDLDFSVYGQENIKKIEKLLKFDTVQVDDSFVNRTYKASLRLISWSYQEGRQERYYKAEIRELDTWPKFNILEIDGHKFSVLKYKESEQEDDVIGRYALLRLSKNQFGKLQEIFKHKTVQIRRINVDEKPITMKFMGKRYWSEHKEGRKTYYKQIIRLFPHDYLPKHKLNMATGTELISLAILVMSLSIRLEALINELAQNNILSDKKRDMLLQKNWKKLLDNTRKKEILEETDLQLHKALDAEEEFD